jgi:hypothetical protein
MGNNQVMLNDKSAEKDHLHMHGDIDDNQGDQSISGDRRAI